MRYIKNTLLALLTVMAAGSCVSEVDDTFDKASSQRIEEAMSADKAILVNQPNGWLLKIYGNLDFGGYNMLLQFNADNTLKVVSEAYYGGIGSGNYGQSNKYEVEDSHYKLEQSSGVVLSFDQFAKNIHFFSDPANPAGMGENYRGFYADLEFRVLSASADSVVLQGKKHGNHLVMVPAPVGPSGWQSYLDQVFDVEDVMREFSNFKIHMDGLDMAARFSYRSVTVTVPGDSEEDGNTYVKIPYTVTPQGYEFYEPVEIKGHTLTGFKYAENTLFYPEMSNSDITLEALIPPINEQFVNDIWFTSMSNLGEFGQQYWGYLSSTIMPVINGSYPGTLDYAYFGLEDGEFGLFYKVIGYWGLNGFDYKLSGEDTVTLTYNPKKNAYNANTFSGSGWLYMGAFVSAPFGNDQTATPVSRTFKITTDDTAHPTWVLLTDVDEPTNTIRLTSAEIGGALFTK